MPGSNMEVLPVAPPRPVNPGGGGGATGWKSGYREGWRTPFYDLFTTLQKEG